MSSTVVGTTTMRIAKRIARSGRCSRREAERLIASGVVQLNGVIVTSPAINVTLKDRIVVDGEVLSPIQRTRVVLANKLKGELVTTNDEEGFLSCCSLMRRTQYRLQSTPEYRSGLSHYARCMPGSLD